MSGSILRNVSRGSFFLATEQLVGLVSGLLYSIIVLRWLGPWTYGMLSLGLAIVGLASVATGNFEVYLERFAAEYEARRQMGRLARAHLLTLALKVGCGLVAGAVLAALAPWLAARYHEPILAEILWVLAGLTVCEAFIATGRAVLFGLQRFGWMAAVALAVQGFKVAAVTLLWVKAQGLIVLAVLLLGLAVVQGVILTGLAVAFVRRGRAPAGGAMSSAAAALVAHEGEPSTAAAWAASPAVPAVPGVESGSGAAAAAGAPLLGAIFRYCLPLLGARAAFLSGQNLSRVVLGAFMSLENLGYFSFAFTLVDRFVGFVYALPSSLLPSFTQLVARGDTGRFTILFDKAFRLVATAAALLSAGLFLFAHELTLVVGGKSYLPAVPVLALLGLVPWARTAQQPLTMAFYALRRTGRVLQLALVKLVTEVGAYFLLIPGLGLLGAAWASLAGAVVSLAAALILLGLDLPPSRHRWTVMVKTATLMALAVATGQLLGAATAAWPWGLWIGLALKLLLVAPAFVLGVFLLDLVTFDDLARAAGVEIRSAPIRALRDGAVRAGFFLSRSLRPLRPRRLGTTESH
jgi:PST family polysaccharide transporter